MSAGWGNVGLKLGLTAFVAREQSADLTNGFRGRAGVRSFVLDDSGRYPLGREGERWVFLAKGGLNRFSSLLGVVVGFRINYGPESPVGWRGWGCSEFSPGRARRKGDVVPFPI